MEFFLAIKYTAIALAFLAIYLLVSQFRSGYSSKWRQWWVRAREPRPYGGRGDGRGPRRLALLGLLAGLVTGFMLSGGAWDRFSGYFWSLLLGAVGYNFPRVLAWLSERQRLKTMTLQLPDALEIIGNSLRAGLSLMQALEVASQETARPLADEFFEVVRDCRLGLPPEDALEKMLKRWPNPDLELFVIAAGVSLRTGGNLAEVTARLIGTVRERFRLQGRIESLTAQGKLSGWVVGLLPLGLLVALIFLDPPLMADFFRHPLGWLILSGGLFMELIGAFFIIKIVTIDT